MRLINARPKQCVEFSASSVSRYAILSHIWNEVDEVSFQDLRLALAHPEAGKNVAADKVRSHSGFRKIERCCAERLGLGLGQHLLYRQGQQLGTVRVDQFHVSVVSEISGELCCAYGNPGGTC